MSRPRLILAIALTFLSLGADAPSPPLSFRNQVAPILVKRCLGCHNAKKAASGLSMETFAALKEGGKSGGELILEPGDPEGSQLIEVVRRGGAPRMPYKQPPLGERDLRTLERWVAEGTKFDGPSETETRLATLVDPLRDLPKVALKVKAADPVTSLAYAPDGKTLAAAVGATVVLFDAASGTPSGTLSGHPGPLTTVRITPDGKTLVALGGRAGMFGAITVWDLGSKAKRFDLRGPRDSVLGAAVSPDGKTLASASYDRQVVLWDLAEGKEVRRLTEHTDAVYAVAFAPDGKTLASAGADRTVKLWDFASGRRLRTLSDATAELYAVTFDTKGETVMAGGVDRSIHVWRVSATEAPLLRSVFAHDAPILRLAVSSDGTTLASSGEDKDVKLWELPGLSPRKALDEQPDWPQGLAISPDGARIAVGRFDGSLSIYATATGKVALTLATAPAPAIAAKVELVRNATLNPPAPRGAVRGGKVRLTLTGLGVGRATAVVFSEAGLAAAIVPAAKPDPNRLDVDLAVAADARVGIHRVGVITPLGVPAFQPFVVSADPERLEVEPNDDPARAKDLPLPATLVGTIDRPGDVDHFRFPARRGDQLVFETQAKSLGSGLLASLSLIDDQGRVLAESDAPDGNTDPTLTLTVPRDGVVTLKVADADYTGSGNHFYRITAGPSPTVASVFPLGVERGTTATIAVTGLNLGTVERVALPVAADTQAGTIIEVPVIRPDGVRPINRRTVVVADGPQRVEAEGNDAAETAEPIATPGGISARIGRPVDVDHFRFEAKAGQPLIVEVFGRRLGSPLDPAIEVLDAKGRPVPRAVLRPVDQTEVAFRDHGSAQPGIRLTRWNNLAINDYVLIGRELARIQALPKNPDDDCAFWSEQGQRLGFLGTTPEHHPMAQPIYKVEIHPPGTVFPTGGVPPVTLTYRNDDGGPGTAKDSKLAFDPPTDGTYIARVEDVRGLGGESSTYHLVVRSPRPDFRLALGTDNPNVPRGGTTLVTATVARIDGFDAAVDVTVEGLPEGVSATPARIEGGETSAVLALSATATAPAFSPPTWRVVARAASTSSADGSVPVHPLDPGGSSGGWITVTPEANLAVSGTPARVAIRPGQQVAMTLAVRRAPAFSGRVPIEVRNLPQGVRVLNIGLNGVLVTETQAKRTIFLYAEPWASAMERPFFAVGKAEAAGTEHSSPPLILDVLPDRAGPSASASRGTR